MRPMSCPPARLLSRALLAPAVLTGALLVALPLAAQPVAGDRSEVEEKRRQREEMERKKAEAVVKETAEQQEARERIEKRDAAVKAALKKAQEAIVAASKHQNQKGMELMEAAWMLDPVNIDYPFNVAAFGQALGNMETEFRAWAAVKILAKKALAGLPVDSPRKSEYEPKIKQADERLDFLRAKLSTGVLNIKAEPASCEVFLEGTYVGVGGGEVEALTGQRKAEARCPAYFDTELFVNVRQGDPTAATIKPKPIPYFGKLIIKVEPADGVTVFLDDVPVGDRLAEKPTKDGKIVGKGSKQEPFELAARKWIIRFQKDGYDRWHRRIEIRRDQTTQVEARLESLAELQDAAPPTVPAKTTPTPKK